MTLYIRQEKLLIHFLRLSTSLMVITGYFVIVINILMCAPIVLRVLAAQINICIDNSIWHWQVKYEGYIKRKIDQQHSKIQKNIQELNVNGSGYGEYKKKVLMCTSSLRLC